MMMRVSCLFRGFLRSRISIALMAVVAMFAPVGCGDAVYCYFNYCPTEEDLAYDAALEAYTERVANAVDLDVRIDNQTGVIIAVNITSAFQEPPCYYCDFAIEEYSQVDAVAALIDAGGTATGHIKCGELLIVSSTVPYDVSVPLAYGQQCGFSTLQGNVNFSGVGSSGETDVSGDVVASTRCIRPADDGIDCENGTLVITIRELEREAEFDEETGELISPQVAAMGTIEAE